MNTPTGLSSDTFNNIEVDAGIVLKNSHDTLTASTVTNAATFKTALEGIITAKTNVLGATRGGGSFTATPSIRTIEADGMRYPIVGSNINDTWETHLKTTLIECHEGNFALAFPTGTVAGTGKVKTLTVATDIDNADYISDIEWVGMLADGTYQMITIFNALNVAEVNYVWADKNNATLAIDFKAHCEDLSEQENGPFEINWFHPGT